MGKKINPKRGKGEQWLLYTMAEGQDHFGAMMFTKDEFQELVKKSYFQFSLGDYQKRVYPAFAMLVKVIEGHDFVIEQINGKQLATGQELIFRAKSI